MDGRNSHDGPPTPPKSHTTGKAPYHEVGDDVDVAEVDGVGRDGEEVVDLDDVLVADEVLRWREKGRGGLCMCEISRGVTAALSLSLRSAVYTNETITKRTPTHTHYTHIYIHTFIYI